jgi:lipopolysaccharide/colanic/teichoic acid biosynthesis glycosyltransferase
MSQCPQKVIVELFSSQQSICGNSASQKSAQKATFGNGASACDRVMSACETTPMLLSGIHIDRAESADIPYWKRILDVACILLCLPFWLPVVIVVALWVLIASPGPIFFRQERIGYRGRPFMMFKFRTMRVNAETASHENHLKQLMQANCPMTKLDCGDPRIIRGGRVLRAMGLDELPQLFNVLRGEMSLVGPRPCTPKEFEAYQIWQRERVNAQPGLTGYWQVNGKNRTTFTEMVEMDIAYTKNKSLRLDLEIMLRTAPAVMKQFFEARSRAPRPEQRG